MAWPSSFRLGLLVVPDLALLPIAVDAYEMILVGVNNEAELHVHVDQAGHDSHTPRLNDLCALRNLNGASVSTTAIAARSGTRNQGRSSVQEIMRAFEAQ